MKITHYICPRACGKTTKAKEIQMEDPENIILYTGLWSFDRDLRGERYKKIILDDYIQVYKRQTEPGKEKLIDWIRGNIFNCLEEKGELILFSTSDKLYSQEEICLASLVKYPPFLSDYKILNIQKIKDRIREINDKFLNPSEVEIIKTNFNRSKLSEEYKQSIRIKLGEDIYKTDMEGEFLK